MADSRAYLSACLTLRRRKHGCDVCPQATDTVTTNISCRHAPRLSQTQAYTVSPNEREGGMDEKEMRTEIIISDIWHVATELQVFVNSFCLVMFGCNAVD